MANMEKWQLWVDVAKLEEAAKEQEEFFKQLEAEGPIDVREDRADFELCFAHALKMIEAHGYTGPGRIQLYKDDKGNLACGVEHEVTNGEDEEPGKAHHSFNVEKPKPKPALVVPKHPPAKPEKTTASTPAAQSARVPFQARPATTGQPIPRSRASISRATQGGPGRPAR